MNTLPYNVLYNINNDYFNYLVTMVVYNNVCKYY